MQHGVHASERRRGSRAARNFRWGAVRQGIGGALIFNPVLLQLTVNPQARLPTCLLEPTGTVNKIYCPVPEFAGVLQTRFLSLRCAQVHWLCSSPALWLKRV